MKVNRMEVRNEIPNFPNNTQTLYKELKARQSEYINLIKDLHQQNYRLRQLLKQQERKIQCLTNNRSPQMNKTFSFPTLSQSPRHQQSKIMVRRNPSPILQPAPQNQQIRTPTFSPPANRNSSNFNMERKISPSKNPNVGFQKQIYQIPNNNHNQIPTKEEESIPVFKPDQMFKNIIKKSKELTQLKTQLHDQKKEWKLEQSHDFTKIQEEVPIKSYPLDNYLSKRQKEEVKQVEKIEEEQNKSQKCDDIIDEGSKIFETSPQSSILKTLDKNKSDSTFKLNSSNLYRYSYGHSPRSMQLKEKSLQIPKQQTKKHRITNRIYL